MSAPLAELPTPAGRTGWPWTGAAPSFPECAPDGTPWPRISLITPSFNSAAFLEETIRSVLLQGYPNLEYILIDGGSRDGTVEIIRRYEPWLSAWVSEADRGQYHALNKGFARASGRILNWINSDDILLPDALRQVALAFLAHPDQLLAGGHQVVLGERVQDPELPFGLEADNFARYWVNAWSWNSTATFFTDRMWSRCGPLNESLRFAADYELTLKFVTHFPVHYLRVPLGTFRYHPGSKTVAKSEEDHLETARIAQACWPPGVEPPDFPKVQGRYMACFWAEGVWRALFRARPGLASQRLIQALQQAPGAACLRLLPGPRRLARLWRQSRVQL